jgi:hypothetical protein
VITKLYDDAEKEGSKPPNVKEIAALVQRRLRDEGYETSGRHIQELAGADRHKSRRRKPGTTLLSERHRQKD